MEPATERGQEAFIFGGNGCSGFGRKASETPGGMRSIGKKKGGGLILSVENRPINGVENSQPLP